MAKLGMEAALYLAASSGDTPPIDLTGLTVFNEVTDVTQSISNRMADVTTRANGGFLAEQPTLSEVAFSFTHIYDAEHTLLTALRTACLNKTPVDAAVISAATGNYEGLAGKFHVEGFEWGQALEEGQAIEITLKLYKFGAWLSGTHA